VNGPTTGNQQSMTRWIIQIVSIKHSHNKPTALEN